MFWVPGFTRQKSGGKVSAKLTSPSNGIAANAAMSVMKGRKTIAPVSDSPMTPVTSRAAGPDSAKGNI